MLKRIKDLTIFFSVSLALPIIGFTQPTWTLDPFGKEKKPPQFEERTLGSERTAEKKFTLPRHFIQNTVTHYNYYFNANNKVNNVVEKAKMSFKDDYTSLLAFYPYTLENTAREKTDLDSVIYTCTAGILIHDLRNDWIDNMYLLIGKAYFFRKEFDSAAMTFQFINFNLFPRDKNEEDNRVVGTNSSASGSSISIANKEKRNFIQKIVSLPPSRNDALIWMARTLIEQNEFGESAGLINTLQNDPNLPKRLRSDLDEVNAYWFFKQGGYDSSATHLEKALNKADNKQDKARWEFLLGELYEMNHQYTKASTYYLRSAKTATDPLLDIYARLNEAKMLKGSGNPKELDRSISNLLSMAKRDKFESFRDIVYYAAGQLGLQKPDTSAAVNYFRKSLKYNAGNIHYKNKAFLQLADIAYNRKQYRLAASLYDSLALSDTTMAASKARVETRRAALSKLVDAITKIEREDSLQRIAVLPLADRDAFIKKLLKKLRKDEGLKDDSNNDGGGSNPFNNNTQRSADLFASSNEKGEWYFYNSSLKSRGFNDFKSKWGNRQNVDNWRRKAASELPPNNVPNSPGDNNKDNKINPKGKSTIEGKPVEVTFDELMKDLPLTDEKLKLSNEILAAGLFDLAEVYKNELDEYALAVEAYEDLLKRFPLSTRTADSYLGLYYCYSRLGNTSKSAYYKDLLNAKFPNSPAARLLSNTAAVNGNSKNKEATGLYENIYNLFIEGDFEKAITEKKKADSLYGVNYWTPQLLYIEALFNVKMHNDSAAIAGLQRLVAVNPASPLKQKASTMISVLNRRKEIETYLTNLQVTRDTGNNRIIIPDQTTPDKKAVPVTQVLKDSIKKAVPALVNGPFTMSVGSPHFVVMALDKVDPVYINEARNALNRYNNENYYNQTLNINKDTLDAERNLLVIASFTDANMALHYYDKIKKDVASEISWLPPNKYSFFIITAENLRLLKSNKNLPDYKKLLNTQYPNRF